MALGAGPASWLLGPLLTPESEVGELHPRAEEWGALRTQRALWGPQSCTGCPCPAAQGLNRLCWDYCCQSSSSAFLRA